jgi:hypothetical protein
MDENIVATLKAISAATERHAGDPDGTESRTELDSHANMPVVGIQAFILGHPGKRVDVSPFSPDYEPLEAELVDAAVLYCDKYTGESYVMVLRNAIHVPSMNNNLIPPFIMREAGIIVNDVPKIQVNNPTEEHHAILFQETGLRIPLSLWGTFSYFPTTKPTKDQLMEPPDVYLITPTRWDPHNDAYAFNEEAMLDWEGNMVEKKHRDYRIVLEDVSEDPVMVEALSISSVEQKAIDCYYSLERRNW